MPRSSPDDYGDLGAAGTQGDGTAGHATKAVRVEGQKACKLFFCELGWVIE